MFIFLTVLIVQPEAFSAYLGPGWGSSEYSDFAGSLITPQDSLVQQKLRSIAAVQDVAHFAQSLLKVYESASQLPIMERVA